MTTTTVVSSVSLAIVLCFALSNDVEAKRAVATPSSGSAPAAGIKGRGLKGYGSCWIADGAQKKCFQSHDYHACLGDQAYDDYATCCRDPNVGGDCGYPPKSCWTLTHGGYPRCRQVYDHECGRPFTYVSREFCIKVDCHKADPQGPGCEGYHAYGHDTEGSRKDSHRYSSYSYDGHGSEGVQGHHHVGQEEGSQYSHGQEASGHSYDHHGQQGGHSYYGNEGGHQRYNHGQEHQQYSGHTGSAGGEGYYHYAQQYHEERPHFDAAGVRAASAQEKPDTSSGTSTGQETAQDQAFLSQEKDFQTEQAQRSNFQQEQFVFTFPEGGSQPGGSVNAFTIAQAPVLGALPGSGMAQALVDLVACGLNQPHVHPRGIETAYIIKGKVRFGIVEENTGRYLEANMTSGQSIVIPQGLMHFNENMECEDAQFIASFPTRDPGVQTIASNFFRLPENVVRATLGVADIQALKEAATNNANPSLDPECLKRCGKAPAPEPKHDGRGK